MIDDLNRVDNIARYYFLGIFLLVLLIAWSSLAVKWFSVTCFALSCIHLLTGIGLLRRKKWGLRIARWYVGIDVFKRNPLSEWLANLNDNQLDQFFR
jgi:hypothetical protein